jgi:molybdate transport system regulatory protein
MYTQKITAQTTRRSGMQLVGRILLDTDEGSLLAEKRVKLLEAIAQHGTIQKAAQEMGLSYKGAWDAVNAMNNLCDEPLVIREVGGRRGGGSHLTEQGRALITLYRTVEAEYQQLLDRMNNSLGDMHQFHRMMNRFAMRTSARNQFHGVVTALIQGMVNCEVRMNLDDQTEIVAMITNESAENLDLRLGLELFALIKTSYASVHTQPLPHRNCFAGVVADLVRGEQSTEVRVDLPSGKSVISAVSNQDCDTMALALDLPVYAAFSPNSVILALVS